MNYYNDNDAHACAWLRELIKQGLIPDGWVDDRSIVDVRPHELLGYTQQHFFAGIGGWAYALRLAGWPDDKPVRTGSCPCQPFSQAGKGLGEEDARHLWPVFRDLITFGEPTVTFGEQVASAAGRDWLAGVRIDLAGLGYEVGAADLCAASVGAPHIRQRLYWVAYAESAGRRKNTRAVPKGALTGVREAQGEDERRAGECSGRACDRRAAGGLGDANDTGLEERISHTGIQRTALGTYPRETAQCGGNAWDSFDLLPCTDGKARRIESGSFPLAHGVSGRVGLLRGYGNGIVPQVAAEFIQAFCDL